MLISRKPIRRIAFGAALLLLVLLLTGCGITEFTAWPGVSAVDSRVYVAYDNRVVALDVAEKTEVWQYNGQSASEKFYAPPAVADGRVIIGDNGVSGGIFAGGRLIVKVHALQDGDSSPPATAWVAEDQVSGRVFGGALVSGGRTYFGTGDNYFYAINIENGQKVWEFRTNNAIWDTPIEHNGVVYFSALDKTIYALKADSGEPVWQVTLDGASASSPVLNADLNLLYTGSFDGNLYALNIADGSIAWKAPASDWIWSSPALEAGVVYFADLGGSIQAVDASTGLPVWSNPVTVAGAVEASLLVDNGKLFVLSSTTETIQGYVTAFDLNGEQLWQVNTPAPVRGNPVIADGALIVAFVSDEVPLQVVRYNVDSGASEWTYTPATEE